MRARITRVALATSMMAFLLFLLPLGVAVHLLNIAEARSSLETVALQTAVRVDPAFSVGDQPEIPTRSGFRIALYDVNGTRVAGVGPRRPDAAVRSALAGQPVSATSGGDLAASLPLSRAETITGVIRVSEPMSSVWTRTVVDWAGLILLAAIATSGGILVARRLAARLSRPIADLLDGAARLGSGDFRIQLRLSGVPEMDAASTALNVTAERLGDLLLRERRMSANISHQLRTPLTGLRAVLENAIEIPGSDLEAAARRAIADADRLESTIDAIIALERERPQAELVQPRDALDDVEKHWKGTFGQKGRLLRTVGEGNTPYVAVSGQALQQILDILIDNAMHHGVGVVTVTARGTHGMLAFDVEDEGAGMPDGFDPFVRGASGKGGSGLGLDIAKSLADDQSGRLLLSQRLPRTRFTLLLPTASGDDTIVTL